MTTRGTETLEPRDKLDTVTVNDPRTRSWTGTPWTASEVEVDARRLRHRIFTAPQAGDLKKVRNLGEADAPLPRERSAAACGG